jgi:pimeloyl-ACP methyl ester carboxylesterase
LEKGIEYYTQYLESVAGPALTPELKAQRLSLDLKVLHAFCSSYEFWPSVADILPKMNIPCLLFAGSADPRYDGAVESVKHMPDATFIPFPRLGHSQCLERIDLVLPHLKKFLAGVNGVRPNEE